MTMLTIIVSSVVLLRFGVSGTSGMFFVMAVAGVVSTALAISGQFVTDLKTGYWLGSTPAAQEKVKFLGIAAAAIAAGLTIVMLARAFQFGEAAPGDARVVLPAPQAAIMKSLVEGFMSQQPVAYILFGAGAVIAVIMEMLGVPALIFALGMYLPLELNTPALVGGFLAHFLGRKAEREGGARGASIRERGVVVASGLMAGGALGGVFGAALRLVPGYTEEWVREPVLRERGRLPDRLGAAVRRAVRLRLARGERRPAGGLRLRPASSSYGLAEVLGRELPVQELVEDHVDVVGAAVAVVDVVGVLPDVDRDERLLARRGERRLGVRRLLDLELAALEDDPRPAAAELA